MIEVHYPEPEFRIKKEGVKSFIFDAIRKTWILLTEEEWVRQMFLSFLIRSMHYPSSLIAVEKEIRLNDLRKRFDIVVYNADHQPWMLIECKAPQVALNDEVLQQALRYNMSLPVSYIVITNGSATIGWHKGPESLHLLQALPMHPC